MKRLLCSYALIFLLCWVNVFNGLTPEQSACVEEFLEHLSIQKIARNSLSEKDTETFDEGILHVDAPEKVAHAVRSFAEKFYRTATEQGLKLSFEQDFLAETLLQGQIDMQDGTVDRPTEVSKDAIIRMYVYSQLPIEDKRKAYKNNFLDNPKAAETAFEKCADLYACLLAEFGRISDTEKAKSETARAYLKTRMAELQYKYS